MRYIVRLGLRGFLLTLGTILMRPLGRLNYWRLQFRNRNR